MSSQILPGQKLANGRFTLLHLLGRGGMGEVWLATDERLQEQAALKFLPSEIQADPAALDDLRKETARSRKLAHANIVRIHDLHEDADGMPFIGMEYVDGPTLAILRVQQPMRVLTWDYVRPLLGQLCLALEYAHGEKVVHRDLKPANVMVDSQGRLKLADFGIAAVVNNSMSRISMRHATSGTLAYMSPQQLSGERPQPTDDIYAMGAMLYELLTSKPPFYAGDITHQVLHKAPEPLAQRMEAVELKNEVPAEVSALVMACLAKEPGQRPQSARAVAEQIGLWGSAKRPAASLSRPAVPGPKSTDENLVPKLAQNWKWAVAGMAVLVAAGLFWLWPAGPRQEKSKALVEPTITNTPAAIDVSAELAKARAEMLQLSNQMAQKATDAEHAHGGLLLTTLPAGATVLLGGEDAQTSPAIFKGIKTGRYPLRVELEGYEPVSREIEIQENQFTNLGAIPLVRQTGIVRVESVPAGASVASGGQVLGTTPLDLPSVPTGPVSYVLTLDGYEPGKLSAKVKKGDQLTLLAALWKTPNPPPSAPLTPQSAAVRDWSKSTLQEVEAAAANNDAQAQAQLGWRYGNGKGVAQDDAKAAEWYRKAADQGSAQGQYNLGVKYESGKGVAQDYAEAVKWYRQSADQGYAFGQINLGVMYEHGKGVAQDYAEAIKWYRKAADQGYAFGQINLGVMYEHGQGVAQDYAEAIKWYRKAADQGNANGQAYLGWMYDHGKGVAQDDAEAVKWYRQSADQGYAFGQINLGVMYEHGQGVAQDYAEAIKWYRKAADQGNAQAKANLARLTPPATMPVADGQIVVVPSAAELKNGAKIQVIPATVPDANAPEVAVIRTTEGVMVIEFWTEAATNTIANFKKLAKAGFYDGTCFHRVIKGFMIQGGDPLSKDPSKEAMWGTGDPGYKIKAEFNDHPHVRGVISMARSQSPDSAGSQFFICLGNPSNLDHQYTTFGKVIKGDDVLQKIGDTPVEDRRGEMSSPAKRVGVISIRIVPAGSVK